MCQEAEGRAKALGEDGTSVRTKEHLQIPVVPGISCYGLSRKGPIGNHDKCLREKLPVAVTHEDPCRGGPPA